MSEQLKAKLDLISVKEAAAILRLSEISVRRYLTQKRLARYKAGGRGRFGRTLVSRAQVLGLIREA
jgi:excisionase family DNA binding protein